ncbi:MAG: UbiA family prenyltransferase [Deltaproteobacteria bacterium]|nr:UbiA family prenyltransferase [Deltaproteobacteria bacterium]
MLNRWLVYLREMYPPIPRIVFALALTGSVIISTQRANVASRFGALEIAVGALTTFLFLLYYRVFDEFKDADVDAQFFPSRPLPAGRITKRDLRILGWLCAALMVAANFAFARNALVAFALLIGFSVLMIYNFFAWDLIANNRVLAFITHVPVVICLTAYLAALGDVTPPLLVLAWFFPQGGVFEFARKTRAPQEEVAGYQTLSSMLGFRRSIGVAIFFIAAQAAILIPYSATFERPAFSISFQLATFVYPLVVFIRFFRDPSRGSARLRPAAEVFGAGVAIVPVVDWAVAKWIA